MSIDKTTDLETMYHELVKWINAGSLSSEEAPNRRHFISLSMPLQKPPDEEIVGMAKKHGFAGVDRGRKYIDGNPTKEVVIRVFLRAGQNLSAALRLLNSMRSSLEIQPIPPERDPALMASGATAGVTNPESFNMKRWSEDFQDQVYPSVARETKKKFSQIKDDNALALDPNLDLKIIPANPVLQSLEPGQSVRHKNTGPGALSAVVYENGSGDEMLMSCWHVLAHPSAEKGNRTLSTIKSGSSNPDNSYVAGLHYFPLPDEKGDVAVSRLNPNVDYSTDHRFNNSHFPVTKHKRVELSDIGKEIYMASRFVGHKMGVIDGVGTYFLDFGPEIGVVGIEGFRVVPKTTNKQTELSVPGDSGFLRYIDDHGEKVGVGIHFAGEPVNGDQYSEYALACHLGDALEKLGVSMTKAEAIKKPRFTPPQPVEANPRRGGIPEAPFLRQPLTCPNCGFVFDENNSPQDAPVSGGDIVHPIVGKG